MHYIDSTLPSALADARALAAADAVPAPERALLYPDAGLEVVRVTGRDRVRFLHAMLSNAVQGLAAGAGCWATFNNVQGRVVSDLRVLAVDLDPKSGHHLLLVERGAGATLADALDRFVISEKVFFEGDESAVALVAGPGAADAVASLGLPVPAEPLAHAPGLRADLPLRVVRIDRLSPGHEDFALIGPAAAWQDAGLPRGDVLLREAERIRGGQIRFGVDLTSLNIPLEAGLKDRAINFRKGCYIGQEVICRIDSMGAPARRLVRLTGGAPAPGTPLFADGKEVGWVTSSLPGPAPMAFGYVHKKANVHGGVVRAGASDGAALTIGAPLGVA